MPAGKGDAGKAGKGAAATAPAGKGKDAAAPAKGAPAAGKGAAPKAPVATAGKGGWEAAQGDITPFWRNPTRDSSSSNFSREIS